MPVIGASSLFILDRAGWAREAGLSLSLTKFDTGPAAIQAFASGSFDVLAIGVAPIAVARAKGLQASIVAAAGLGGSSFVASADLGAQFEAAGNAPGPAFAAFRKRFSRRAKLATLPPGGVPNAALNYWLFETGKTEPADVELVYVGIDAIQQAVLAGAVDGATVLEPSATIALGRNPRLKAIVSALDMFPGIPGVAIAVSQRVLTQQRAAILSLVKQHVRATKLLTEQPDVASTYVADVLGGGFVEASVMERALRSHASTFLADPNAIVQSTQRLLTYEVALGDFPQAPALDGLFDLTVWRDAA